MKIRINGWQIEDKDLHLSKEGSPVRKIGKHELLVLKELIKQADSSVTTNELIDKAWPNKVVSKNSLTQAIRNIRFAVDDNGTDVKVISTINGVGYKLSKYYLEELHSKDVKRDTVIRRSFTSCLLYVFLITSIGLGYNSYWRLNYFLNPKEHQIYPEQLLKSKKLQVFGDVKSEDFLSRAEDLVNKNTRISNVYILIGTETISLSIIYTDDTIQNTLIINDGLTYESLYENIIENIK
ncbi:transcriptional regulator [Vibrio sp. 10N.261.49.A12]|uniref:winged helix-turn-helix domain-containing protein n=1 Tax=Vibrio sp. 10N.261.49.A12 TaxID=3229667 RepID=UPI00354BF44A